jgi:hypothetical protein
MFDNAVARHHYHVPRISIVPQFFIVTRSSCEHALSVELPCHTACTDRIASGTVYCNDLAMTSGNSLHVASLGVARSPGDCPCVKGCKGQYQCYTPEGRGVQFPMQSLEFFIVIILSAELWHWVDSASNRNEYKEYFMGVRAAGV